MKHTTYRLSSAESAAERPPPAQGPMRLGDLVYGPWAIVPQHLLELQAIYETHLRGEKIDVRAIEARLGRPLANEPRAYEVLAGVAVLPIEGVVSPKANLMMEISGGVSAQLVLREIAAARADPGVRSVVLAIDSPGGNVALIAELAQAISTLALSKPVVAHTDGVLASAAYWFGSAANAVYISGPAVQVGSIGVLATHRESSAAQARAGVKTTEVTAGRYKRLASANEPLSAEGRASLQAQVDYLYGLFVDAVAAHRGVDVAAVLEHMADGRVFIGQQAIDAGLVDGVSTLDALVDQMAADPKAFATRRKAVIKAAAKPSRAGVARAAVSLSTAPPTTTATGATMPDADTQPTNPRAFLEAEQPALFAELQREFTAAGAAQERERIKGVREQLMPGHEALIERLAGDGKSTPAEAAMAVNAAQRASLAAAAKAHHDDAPPAAKAANAPADEAVKPKDQQVTEARAYAAAHKVDFVAAMKALGFAA